MSDFTQQPVTEIKSEPEKTEPRSALVQLETLKLKEAEKQTKLLNSINGKLAFFVFFLLLYAFIAFIGALF